MSDTMTQWMQAVSQATCQQGGLSGWQPAADVYRLADGWLVKLDLAGVSPDEVAIHRDGKRLIVSGARRDQTTERGCCHYRMEISYSRFERAIELPCRLDTAAIHAEARDGMFLIRVTDSEGTRKK